MDSGQGAALLRGDISSEDCLLQLQFFSLQKLFFPVEVSHLNLDYQYKFSAHLGCPRSS